MHLYYLVITTICIGYLYFHTWNDFVFSFSGHPKTKDNHYITRNSNFQSQLPIEHYSSETLEKMTIPLPSLPYTVESVPENFLQFSNASSSPPSPPPSRDSSSNNQESKESVLWIGCSDSLVSETDALTNVKRSEIFVHRNLGNRVSVGDTSSGSAIEWAVDVLKVCQRLIPLKRFMLTPVTLGSTHHNLWTL